MIGAPKVSVVMPTFNGERFISIAIKSILSQTYTNFEFIIVDDGSTDKSASIIKNFYDDRIKYIYQDNRGPASAYNTGFKNATTDFIFVMDHDDISYPIRLEKQLEYLVNNNLDVCGTNYEIFHEKNGYTEIVRRNYNDMELKEKLLYLPSVIFNPTVCLKKDVFKKFGYFDEEYKVTYDGEFYTRIMFDVKMGIVPICLYRWHHHKPSYSSQKRIDGKKVSRLIGLKRLNQRKSQLSNFQYYSSIGLLNYYTNRLTKASLMLLFSMFFGINKTIIKYFLVATFTGPIVKLARKFDLIALPVIREFKKLLLPF